MEGNTFFFLNITFDTVYVLPLVPCGYFNHPLHHNTAGGGREGHLSVCKTVYIGWSIALLPHLHLGTSTRTPYSLTLTDIHTSALTHTFSPPFVSQTFTHQHSRLVPACVTRTQRKKRWKMSQIMSDWRQRLSNASMGPMCARTGWRVYDCCPNINTSWMSVVRWFLPAE